MFDSQDDLSTGPIDFFDRVADYLHRYGYMKKGRANLPDRRYLNLNALCEVGCMDTDNSESPILAFYDPSAVCFSGPHGTGWDDWEFTTFFAELFSYYFNGDVVQCVHYTDRDTVTGSRCFCYKIGSDQPIILQVAKCIHSDLSVSWALTRVDHGEQTAFPGHTFN